MSSTIAQVRPREDDAPEDREVKRPKIDNSPLDITMGEVSAPTPEKPLYDSDNLLPPSRILLGLPTDEKKTLVHSTVEIDVGISQYVDNDIPPIHGIIKQRFTDFMVFEVDLQDNEIHVESIGPPVEATEAVAANIEPTDHEMEEEPETEPWPEKFTTKLTAIISEDAVSRIKELFIQGPEPPRPSTTVVDVASSATDTTQPARGDFPDSFGNDRRGSNGRGRGRGRGQGPRGRGGGRVDNRQVLLDPIPSKDTRTQVHATIRELFGGALESVTSTETTEAGSKIAIKWAGRGGRNARGGKGARGRGGPRPDPFIHFTMQKTNRDTHDALSHLARVIKTETRNLAVAGTKDKRGVTVQRVSLKRDNKSTLNVWNAVNGIPTRKTLEQTLSERGERGVRISDLAYKRTGLQLGLLKGNAFLITLRNVKTDSMENLDRAMNTIKDKGFINYYGMQRFGTASVPTHAIGLALLKSDWATAVNLILRPRPGEYPEAEAARRAWLEEGDLSKALSLMPKRVVAERCILESYHKQGGESRNHMGALSTIPRNLRMMYVHAYQSYVWNAIVSERIRLFGCDKPVVGDVVFETSDADADAEAPDVAEEDALMLTEQAAPSDVSPPEPKPKAGGKGKKGKYGLPPVRILGPDDLDKYSIFDVIIPLPGTDVSYPGGPLGDLYEKFLALDGLDPSNFVRKQREYTLGGSYRKLLHLPRHLSWSTLRYTDPDVALAQSDEDKILGFDPPVDEKDGQFLALQIKLTLGTAAYATMALREVTKTDTSSHVQTSLTLASEDQKFKGTQSTNTAASVVQEETDAK